MHHIYLWVKLSHFNTTGWLGQLAHASISNGSTRTLAKRQIALYGNPTNVYRVCSQGHTWSDRQRSAAKPPAREDV